MDALSILTIALTIIGISAFAAWRIARPAKRPGLADYDVFNIEGE